MPPPADGKAAFPNVLLWQLLKPGEGGLDGASRKEGFDPKLPKRKFHQFTEADLLHFLIPHYEPGMMLSACSFKVTPDTSISIYHEFIMCL